MHSLSTTLRFEIKRFVECIYCFTCGGLKIEGRSYRSLNSNVSFGLRIDVSFSNFTIVSLVQVFKKCRARVAHSVARLTQEPEFPGSRIIQSKVIDIPLPVG